MYAYRAFGLHVQSALALPELVPTQGERPDITIEKGAVDEADALSAERRREAYRRMRPGRALLYWPEVGAFQVESGRRITIDAHDRADEALVRLPLLGPVMAALLMQRKRLVLHASAVAIDEHAVAFVGVKGAGKSTTAAAMHRNGWPLVADDVLAVRFSPDGAAVVDPGIPRFKLWPDAAEAALRDDPETLRPLHERVQKRGRTVDGAFSSGPCPLRAIYVLEGGKAIDVEPVEASQALLTLLPHVYNNTLVEASDSRSMRRWHFQTCARLTRRVPVRRLKRPVDLGQLPEVAAQIAADARSLERPMT